MPAPARNSCASSTSRAAITADRAWAESASPALPGGAYRHQIHRKAVLVPLAGLQCPDADHLAGDFFALLVGDRDDHAIFAAFVALRMADRALDAHRRQPFRLLLRIAGVEPQMVLAAGTHIRALQDHRLAVRTYPCCTQAAGPSNAHC